MLANKVQTYRLFISHEFSSIKPLGPTKMPNAFLFTFENGGGHPPLITDAQFP